MFTDEASRQRCLQSAADPIGPTCKLDFTSLTLLRLVGNNKKLQMLLTNSAK